MPAALMALPPEADELREALGPDAVAAFGGGPCAVDGLLDGALIAEAREQTEALESVSGFPFQRDSAAALNQLSLAPRLLRAAGQLLHVARPTDVRLAESVAVPLGAADTEFTDHRDYHLGVVSRECEAVVAIVHLLAAPAVPTAYRSEDGGEHTAEACVPGTVLFCPLGTALRPAPGTLRVVLRAARAEWITADDFIRSGPVQHAETPLQLCALGWPAPGHPHWTAASLAEAAGRYKEHTLAAFGTTLAQPKSHDEPPPPPLIPPPPPADSNGTAWHPPELPAGEGDVVLSDAQVHAFREEGCLLLEGLWPADLVDEACSQAAASIPDPPNQE